MNLYQYLLAVEQDRPINGHRFRSMLNDQDLNIDDLGSLVFVKPGKYRVNNVDQDVLNGWKERFAPVTSRNEASRRAMNSHLHRTSVAYFVAKSMNNLHTDFVIKCDGDTGPDTNSLSNPLGSDVILIENNECYTQCEKFLSNAGVKPQDDATILWSAGKAITHPNAIAFLNRFQTIYYCPDYDLVGVEIYEILIKTLGKKVTFVMPDNLPAYKHFCHKPEHNSHFTKAVDKAREHGFVPMVKLLTTGMGVLEQEVLIEGANEY